MDKKQQDILTMAKKQGASDATLLLLDKLHVLEDELMALKDQIAKEPPQDVKVEKVSMKLAAKLATLEKGDDGHTPTEEELLALIQPLIPVVTDGEDGHTPTTEELLALIRPLIPTVENGHTPTDEELIALITPLIPQIVVPTMEEVASEVEKNLPQLGTATRDGLELLQGDERLDVSAIKGLENYDETVRLAKERPTIYGPGKTRIFHINLSSQLDGVTKTFHLGTHFGISGVHASGAPFSAFQPLIDFNEVGKDIVFTSSVDVASALASGQSLIIDILK